MKTTKRKIAGLAMAAAMAATPALATAQSVEVYNTVSNDNSRGDASASQMWSEVTYDSGTLSQTLQGSPTYDLSDAGPTTDYSVAPVLGTGSVYAYSLSGACSGTVSAGDPTPVCYVSYEDDATSTPQPPVQLPAVPQGQSAPGPVEGASQQAQVPADQSAQIAQLQAQVDTLETLVGQLREIIGLMVDLFGGQLSK